MTEGAAALKASLSKGQITAWHAPDRSGPACRFAFLQQSRPLNYDLMQCALHQGMTGNAKFMEGGPGGDAGAAVRLVVQGQPASASLMDLGLLLFFLVYTFAFKWAFDRVFGLPASAQPQPLAAIRGNRRFTSQPESARVSYEQISSPALVPTPQAWVAAITNRFFPAACGPCCRGLIPWQYPVPSCQPGRR